MKASDFEVIHIYTVYSWLFHWLTKIHSIMLKPSTLDSYLSLLDSHIKPRLGDIPLSDLKESDVQEFYHFLSKKGRIDSVGGLSPKTILNIHRFLNKGLTEAIKRDLISVNPCEYVELPKYRKKLPRVLSYKEQEKLLTYAYKSSYGLLVHFLLGTGFRLGEALALRWSDIDFDDNMVFVQRSVRRCNVYDDQFHKCGTSSVYTSPKSDNSFRQCPLPSLLKSKLYEIYVLRNSDDELVFQSLNGTPIQHRMAQQAFYTICENAHLRDVHLHTLRHTFATNCLAAGIAVKIVSVLLGHSTVKITMDLYQQVSNELKKQAIGKMENFYPLFQSPI